MSKARQNLGVYLGDMTKALRPARWALLLGLGPTLLPLQGLAQSVHGTVRDPSAGSPVADALVVMVNEEGARVATVLTGDEGTFRIDAPVAGTYMVGVARLGYQQAITPEFPVADADVALDIFLPAIRPTPVA